MTAVPVVVLDLETVPLAAALEAPYPSEERQPPANYKAEDAIARWREADRQKWRDDRVKACSVNPRLGRIVCAATPTDTVLAPREADEPALLRAVWAWLAASGGRVVTWNGAFDLRFLLVRSLAHRVAPTVDPFTIGRWFHRYQTTPHFDCKSVLLNGDVKVAGEGLAEWGAFLGLGTKADGRSGADVWPLYQAGDLEAIRTYCQQDAALTHAIYDTLAPYFG